MIILRQIKFRLRQRAFDRAIEKYRGALLEPRFGIRNFGPVLREHAKHRTLAAESARGNVIVKFYFKRSAKAKNGIAAQRLLEAREIPVPRLIHADADAETLDRFGLACLVYERLDGRTMRLPEDAALIPQIARMLARMHADFAPEVGSLHRLKSSSEGWEILREKLTRWSDQIAALTSDEAKSLADGLRQYFAAHHGKPASALGGWSLVHNDISPHNILVLSDGGFVLLDFDLCERGLYGLELAHALPRLAVDPIERRRLRHPANYLRGDREWTRRFLESYMGAAPEAVRSDWERWNQYYILADLTDAVATTAADLTHDRKLNEEDERLRLQWRKQIGLLAECLDLLGV